MNQKLSKAKKQAKSFFFQDTVALAATLATPVSGASVEAGNIIGVGIGPKTVNGAITEKEAVRIYVRVKIPKSRLAKDDVIPAEFNSIPTDVVEVGDVIPLQKLKTWQRFGKNRPTSCGVSIGHPNITAGTLGCLVERDSDNFILSNNHVLADSNSAKINDAIIQPGKADGGSSPADDIATLSDFEMIDFTGVANYMDAAIAKVTKKSDVEVAIVDIGKPSITTKPVVLYQSVRKHGRTTGHTVGVVMDVSVDLWINYGLAGKAWFEDQIMIVGVDSAAFSSGGDSGSLIVDAVALEPVGLLFAGGKTQTFANPIDKVLQRFNVSVAS